jgi:hypothetical protein
MLAAMTLYSQLPDEWQTCVAQFLKAEVSDLRYYIRRECFNIPGDGTGAVIGQDCPELLQQQRRWDMFKYSLNIACLREENQFPAWEGCYALTFQLENQVTKNFLPPEGEECTRFSQVLQRVESEVVSLLDPMLDPLVSSSKRLYWSRAAPTSFLKSCIFFKPGDEWTNFYMAMSESTIAVCYATVYGSFEQQDHMYINRLRVIRMPFGKRGINTAKSCLSKDLNVSGQWIQSLGLRWEVLDASECYCNHKSNSLRGDEEEQGIEESIALAEKMQRCCSLVGSKGHMKKVAEVSIDELFQGIEREINDRQRRLMKQQQPKEVVDIFNELQDEMRDVSASMTGEEYVKTGNEQDMQRFLAHYSGGSAAAAATGCERMQQE